MRLWIDVREACRPRKTGKGQWTYQCVEELLRRSDVQVTLLTDADVPSQWRSLSGFGETRVIPKKGLSWHLAAWRTVLQERSNIDAYVAPTSFIVPFLLGRSVRVVPVVHDLIAFRNEPHDRTAMIIERSTLPRVLRTAHAVCCVSKTTAVAVSDCFAPVAPVVVVGAGSTTIEDATWTGGGNTVLCVGTLCPRKNQLRLLQAFSRLNAPELKLLLVGGRGWSDDAIVEAARTTQNVEWLGFRDDVEVARLLRECKVLAYVSEQEGFGLPVLDALCVGAPVLASEIPTNREVGGDCATYVDPLDIDSIAEGLRRALASPPIPRERVHAQIQAFTWQAAVERLLSACSVR